MSKKKLTKKRKRQLLASLAITGMLVNTVVAPVTSYADMKEDESTVQKPLEVPETAIEKAESKNQEASQRTTTTPFKATYVETLKDGSTIYAGTRFTADGGDLAYRTLSNTSNDVYVKVKFDRSISIFHRLLSFNASSSYFWFEGAGYSSSHTEGWVKVPRTALGGTFRIESTTIPGTNSQYYEGIHYVSQDFQLINTASATINDIYDTDTRVSGTGEPDGQVVITNDTGSKLGYGLVDAAGRYQAVIPAQQEGMNVEAEITAPNGQVSTAKTKVRKSTAPTPVTINTVYEKDQKVTGTAEANSSITVKLQGSGKTLGTGTTNGGGSYSVAIANQVAGAVLEVTSQTTKGPATATTVVMKNPEVQPGKVTIDKVYTTDTKVTGTATPNTSITVSDLDTGKKLGTGTANANGDYSVSVAKQAVGTVLEVVSENSVGSSSATTVVLKGEVSPGRVTINDVYDDDDYVRGIATPKTTITVKGLVGNNLTVIGTAQTDAQGNYMVPIPKQPAGGVLLVISSNSAGETSATTVVKARQVGNKPVINASDKYYLTGTELLPSLGVTALDSEDGDITSSIRYDDSKVNMNTPGDYDLSIEVTDSDGNKTTKTITIHVLDQLDYAPTISGADDKQINNGDAFNPRTGVTAQDSKGNDLTNKLVISGKVDTNKDGQYVLMYYVTDASGKVAIQKRVITVASHIGSDPVIHAADKNYVKGSALLPSIDVTAEDPEDGDLTDKIQYDTSKVDMSVAGDYPLSMSVTDSDGNTATKSITIHVKNQISNLPVITGVADKKIQEGDKFNPKSGVTAADANGKDLTSEITIVGEVDRFTAGQYPLTYYVTDANGNVAVEKRVITVIGEDELPIVLAHDLTIKKGARFKAELYANAYDNQDGDLTDQIKVVGTVDTDKVGDYQVTYSVTDADGNKKSVTITVTVVDVLDNAPVITGATDVTIKVGDSIDLSSGVTAFDQEDGDLTKEIKLSGVVNAGTAGEYEVIYTVWDKDYNTTTVVRHIKVIPSSNEKPVINASDKQLKIGDSFDPMKDVTASDKEDGDVTANIQVKENTVNTAVSGTYKVVYSVTDSDNNTTEKTIAVTVVMDQAQKPTVDTFKVGAGKVTGTGTPGDTIIVNVRNDEKGRGTVAADGKYTVYTGQYRAKKGDTYEVHAENSQHLSSDIVQAQPTDVSGTIKADAYTISDKNVTGTYTGDINTVSLSVDGKVLPASSVTGGKYSLYVGAKISSTSKVEVIGYYNGKEVARTNVVVKVGAVKPTIDSFKVGAGKITGTGTPGDLIIVKVRNNEKGRGTVAADGKYLVYTGQYRAKKGDLYEVQATNGQGQSSEVATASPKELTGTLTAKNHQIGEKAIKGTYSGDINSVGLFVNGKKLSVVSVSKGSYTLAVTSAIHAGDTVEVAGYCNGVEIARIPVKLEQNVKKPTINPIVVGAGKVSGKAEAGNKIVVRVRGFEKGTGTVDASGNYIVYTGSYRAKKGDTYEVQAFNANQVGSESAKAVPVDHLGTLVPDEYSLSSKTITGTYTGDINTVAISIDGVLSKTIPVNNGKISYYVGTTIQAGQSIELIGYFNGQEVDRKPVVIQSDSSHITSANFRIGDVNITGTFDGTITGAKLMIDGKDAGRGGSFKNGNFTFYVGAGKITANSNVKLQGYIASGKDMGAPVSVNITKVTGALTTATFNLKETAIKGSFTGEVSGAKLMLNGALAGKQGGTFRKDGSFEFYIGQNVVKQGDTVQLIPYSKSGVELTGPVDVVIS